MWACEKDRGLGSCRRRQGRGEVPLRLGARQMSSPLWRDIKLTEGARTSGGSRGGRAGSPRNLHSRRAWPPQSRAKPIKDPAPRCGLVHGAVSSISRPQVCRLPQTFAPANLRKPFSVTAKLLPFSVTFRFTMSRSALKNRRHTRSVMIATGWDPGRSSCGRKSRPKAGVIPTVEKKEAETVRPGKRCVSPEPVRVKPNA